MAKSVPSKSSALDAGKYGAVNGGLLAVGETVGRSVLGPGIGTALGGMAAASTESGATRDSMALVAGERAVNELLGGSGGGSGGSRGRM